MSHDADVRRLVAACRLLVSEAIDSGVERDVWHQARLLQQLHTQLDAIHALHSKELDPGLRAALRQVALRGMAFGQEQPGLSRPNESRQPAFPPL